MQLLDPQMPAKIGALQQLDDAIAFRSSRLDMPCPDCASSQKCAEHTSDLHLLDAYKSRYAAAWDDARTGMNPADIGEIDDMIQADDLPPTIAILAAALNAKLRESATTHGPFITELDGRQVVIALADDGTLLEIPLEPAGEDSAPQLRAKRTPLSPSV